MIKFKTKSYTCELPNPELGDTSDIVRGINIKVSRGGTLRAILDTSINSVDSANYILTNLQFNNIPFTKIEEVEKFLRHAAGESVKYVDYNENEWQCSILMDTFDYQSTNRFNSNKKISSNRYIFYDDLGYDFQLTIRRWK
jgi:hypothetical protein